MASDRTTCKGGNSDEFFSTGNRYPRIAAVSRPVWPAVNTPTGLICNLLFRLADLTTAWGSATRSGTDSAIAGHIWTAVFGCNVWLHSVYRC